MSATSIESELLVSTDWVDEHRRAMTTFASWSPTKTSCCTRRATFVKP
jgi:hypothetical protein